METALISSRAPEDRLLDMIKRFNAQPDVKKVNRVLGEQMLDLDEKSYRALAGMLHRFKEAID